MVASSHPLFILKHILPFLSLRLFSLCVTRRDIANILANSRVRVEADSNDNLKVPKRELFDRSDFPDFYTIKSLCVGDFGVKIKFFF